MSNNDRSFNHDLIYNWYARAYLKYPFEYSVEFEKAQAYAKKQQLWIWWDSEVKKKILKQLREDKKVLKQLQEIEEEIDQTIIQQIIDADEQKNIDWENYILDTSIWLLLATWSIFQKLELNEMNKKVRFSQSIVKQKKSLKIYWKTLPDVKIQILFWDKTYNIKSNNKWSYSLKLNTLEVWKFKISSKVILDNGKIYEVPRIKYVEIDQIYISSMNDANYKIYLNKIKKSLNQKVKTKNTIINSSAIVWVKNINWDNSDYENKKQDIPYATTLYSLLSLMSSLMWFLILKKWSII